MREVLRLCASPDSTGSIWLRGKEETKEIPIAGRFRRACRNILETQDEILADKEKWYREHQDIGNQEAE